MALNLAQMFVAGARARAASSGVSVEGQRRATAVFTLELRELGKRRSCPCWPHGWDLDNVYAL